MIAATVHGATITASLPLGGSPGSGELRVFDDVGNESSLALAIAEGPAFTLVLDTTPPVITWGPVAGTTAGELLQAGYSSNEILGSAQLELPDHRILTATITGGVVQVLLPADTPTGLALLTATDEVGNRSEPFSIALVGGTGVRVFAPGPASRVVTKGTGPTRIVFIRTTAGALSKATLTQASTRTHTSLSSRTLDAVRVSQRGLSTSTARSQALSAAAQASVYAIAGALAFAGPTRRRDGPDLEEALLLDIW